MKLTPKLLERLIKEELEAMSQGPNEFPEPDEMLGGDEGPEHAEDCPQCGGNNTRWEEPAPSMMGHGEDHSLYCADCDDSFSVDPFSGGFVGFAGSSHLQREADGFGMHSKCKFCGQDIKTVKTTAGEYFEAHDMADGSPCHGSKSRVSAAT